eukprot:1183666-Prorocentrum_minimum.AAC.1
MCREWTAFACCSDSDANPLGSSIPLAPRPCLRGRGPSDRSAASRSPARSPPPPPERIGPPRIACTPVEGAAQHILGSIRVAAGCTETARKYVKCQVLMCNINEIRGQITKVVSVKKRSKQ